MTHTQQQRRADRKLTLRCFYQDFYYFCPVLLPPPPPSLLSPSLFSLSLCLSHLSPHVSLCLSLSRTDFPTDICAYSSVFEQQCSVSQSASSLIPPSSSLSLSFSSLFPSSPKLSILPSLIINFYTMYTHYRKYTLKESGGRRNRYETDL